jgi:hypothetical protein
MYFIHTGACPTGAGPSPLQSPKDPWPGTCGSGPLKGKGPNAFTSGFEGAWTTRPTEWTNQYFRNLLGFDWAVHKVGVGKGVVLSFYLSVSMSGWLAGWVCSGTFRELVGRC